MLDAEGNEVTFTDLVWIYLVLHADPRYQPIHKSNKATPYTFASGGTLFGHYYQRSQTTEIRFDITSQVTNQHEVKIGGKFKNDLMEFEDFTVQRDTLTYLTPTILSPESPVHDLYTKEPIQFSAYVQDKMEFTSMIINAGVRYDYFNSQIEYLPNTNAPTFRYCYGRGKEYIQPKTWNIFPDYR